MCERISSRSIFHFTDSLDKLLFILRNGFNPKCCVELRDGIESAIPMVSFSDIPLSQIDFHIKKYGHYGVGLCKKWAMKYGITPVMYQANYSKNNRIFNSIIKTLDLIENNDDKVNILKEKLTYFSWFIKNYEGKDLSNGKVIEFYNEREWRYIPNFNNLISNGLFPSLFSKEFKEMSEQFNKLWSDYFNVHFELGDIKYIIVNNEKEVKNVFELFSKLDISENEKLYQAIKILTVKNIVDDF